MSLLPTFCVPWKQYGAAFVGRVLHLVYVCRESFRSAGGRFGVDCRIMAGIWARQWSSRAAVLITVLQNNLKVKRLPRPDLLPDLPEIGIIKDGFEAFMLGSDLALGRQLIGCDGKCGLRPGGSPCGASGACRGILPGLQAGLTEVPFDVWLF